MEPSPSLVVCGMMGAMGAANGGMVVWGESDDTVVLPWRCISLPMHGENGMGANRKSGCCSPACTCGAIPNTVSRTKAMDLLHGAVARVGPERCDLGLAQTRWVRPTPPHDPSVTHPVCFCPFEIKYDPVVIPKRTKLSAGVRFSPAQPQIQTKVGSQIDLNGHRQTRSSASLVRSCPPLAP